MNEKVNIDDTRTQMSQLDDRAQAGEEIVIAHAGQPAAKLVRKPGRLCGRIRMEDSFDDPLPS